MSYQKQLDQWKAQHGLDPKTDLEPDEIRMAEEEQASRKSSWCFGCDREMPVREMKLITRRIDPYVQYDEGGYTDYIAPSYRVRMCLDCFKDRYPQSDSGGASTEDTSAPKTPGQI